MRRLTQALLPGLLLLAATLAAAAPWGLPGGATYIPPLATVMLLFILAAEDEPALPAWPAFAAGLATDLLTAGPLGFWALIYLMTYTLARGFSPETRHWQLLALWVCFAFTIAIVAGAAWGVASLYFVKPVDWRPLVTGAAVVLGLFPFGLFILTWLIGLGPAHRGRFA